jgi:hypothetical protein
MKRYEYRAFICKGELGKKCDPVAELNKIGEEGWIMVHMEVSPQADQIFLLAYREKL